MMSEIRSPEELEAIREQLKLANATMAAAAEKRGYALHPRLAKLQKIAVFVEPNLPE
jgi:hypothetical protein